MRKVLLATTALVAMSVTGAQADVSISGNQNFEMKDNGTATTWFQDGDVQIKSTNTTDSGLTLTAAHHINTSLTTAAAVNAGTSIGQHLDDSYVDIAGEFGSIRLGQTDEALDRMDGAMPSNWDESGNGGFAIGGDKTAASIILPAVSGATIYASSTAEGTYSGMGVNYTSGPVTAMYQSGTNGTANQTLIAVNFTMAGLTVGFGAGDDEPGGGVAKVEHSAMGAKYTVNEALKVYYTSQKIKGGSTANAIGGYYQVAPGLQLAAETANSAASPSVTSTYGHVKVSF
ncbi:porin [Candidatus Puniceispirillum sp.]|nr:porin [Candidatus Puniceispirillum sp.]